MRTSCEIVSVFLSVRLLHKAVVFTWLTCTLPNYTFVYSYRKSIMWADKTMAYYAKMDTFGNFCGKIHSGDSLDVFQMWNDCDYRGGVLDFLCDLESREDVNKDSARASTSMNIGISHGKSPPVPYVKCPDGHTTHAFFVCDVQSACWQDRQESVESEVWGCLPPRHVRPP